PCVGVCSQVAREQLSGMEDEPKDSWFRAFSWHVATAVGTHWAFVIAALVIVAWAATGPLFHYSDTWQLAINTGTTIVTFLMVFLIQNAQYRDAEAVQLKLDELLRVTKGAHNALLDLEELEADELERIRHGYSKLAESAREQLRRGGIDTDSPEVS